MLPGKTKRCLTNPPSIWPTLKQPLEEMEKNPPNSALVVIFFFQSVLSIFFLEENFFVNVVFRCIVGVL